MSFPLIEKFLLQWDQSSCFLVSYKQKACLSCSYCCINCQYWLLSAGFLITWKSSCFLSLRSVWNGRRTASLSQYLPVFNPNLTAANRQIWVAVIFHDVLARKRGKKYFSLPLMDQHSTIKSITVRAALIYILLVLRNMFEREQTHKMTRKELLKDVIWKWN